MDNMTYIEILEQKDNDLFNRIKDNPRPTIEELWSLSRDKFIEWRRIHDFPKLLVHFDNTFRLFKEWKAEYNITNEDIIRCGKISPFLENKFEIEKGKKVNKKKELFLVKRIWNNDKEIIEVSYNFNEGKTIFLNNEIETQLILKFVSYLDWLMLIGEKPQRIINPTRIASPNTTSERVFIDATHEYQGYELLKMGGLEIPINGLEISDRSKDLEFINLSRINLTKKNYLQIKCSYSICNNWFIKNTEKTFLDFFHCSIDQLCILNATLNQCNFYDSIINGSIINTNLKMINIYGGYFNPLFKDSYLQDVEINPIISFVDRNFNGYKNLKILYSNQGDDKKSEYYYIKENECKRTGLFLNGKKDLVELIIKTISKYYWNYGTKPTRIIFWSLFTIVFCALSYFIGNDQLLSNQVKHHTENSLLECLYFSITTYTTLGYGDLSPSGWLRIITSLEALLGLVNMGFLIGGLSNKKY